MSEIIGFRMSVKFRFLGRLGLFSAHTIFSKYYLKHSDVEKENNPLWKIEKIPMVEVSVCCIQDIDEKKYLKDVDKVKKLRYNRL